jgi:hypothetical protein
VWSGLVTVGNDRDKHGPGYIKHTRLVIVVLVALSHLNNDLDVLLHPLDVMDQGMQKDRSTARPTGYNGLLFLRSNDSPATLLPSCFPPPETQSHRKHLPALWRCDGVHGAMHSAGCLGGFQSHTLFLSFIHSISFSARTIADILLE